MANFYLLTILAILFGQTAHAYTCDAKIIDSASGDAYVALDGSAWRFSNCETKAADAIRNYCAQNSGDKRITGRISFIYKGNVIREYSDTCYVPSSVSASSPQNSYPKACYGWWEPGAPNTRTISNGGVFALYDYWNSSGIIDSTASSSVIPNYVLYIKNSIASPSVQVVCPDTLTYVIANYANADSTMHVHKRTPDSICYAMGSSQYPKVYMYPATVTQYNGFCSW